MWLEDGTLTITNTLVQSGSRINAIQAVLHILQSSGLVPHYWIQFSVISRAPHFSWKQFDYFAEDTIFYALLEDN